MHTSQLEFNYLSFSYIKNLNVSYGMIQRFHGATPLNTPLYLKINLNYLLKHMETVIYSKC